MSKKSWVYFVRAGEEGPIKIGRAVDPVARLGDLQISHHEKLTLLAAHPGGSRQERELHSLFADVRIRGEWFRPTPQMMRYIEHLRGLLREDWDQMAAVRDLVLLGNGKRWREEMALAQYSEPRTGDPLDLLRQRHEEKRAATKRASREHSARVRLAVDEYLGRIPCSQCGQNPGPRAKRLRTAGMVSVRPRRDYYPMRITIESMLAEMSACIVYCSNCIADGIKPSVADTPG